MYMIKISNDDKSLKSKLYQNVIIFNMCLLLNKNLKKTCKTNGEKNLISHVTSTVVHTD